MNVTSADIAGMVVKQVIKGDLGKLSLDGQMLNVLISLDGKKTLEQVAQQAGLKSG